MRLTKIICTMGPACNTVAGIRGLAERGMNVARFNFSHGNHDTHREVINTVRHVNKEDGRTIGLLLDTKGPEIRTGDVTEKIDIKAGQEVVFSHKEKDPTLTTIAVNYLEFWKDVKDAECILIDNGEIIFDVVDIKNDHVVAKARGGGLIGSRRHVNLPGADVSLPSISEKDWEDIRLACDEKLDYIAISFIRSGKEVEEVRAFCTKHGHPDIKLISKIENGTGVKNIEGIVSAGDGVMVARGDLGAEIPPETVPEVQDDIVARCRKAGKIVTVATHMLESMIENPTPTRAEVTDIAYAAMIGTDTTMLSGETAAGKHPFEALEMMVRVLKATEKRLVRDTSMSPVLEQVCEGHAAGIVVHSDDGTLAHALSTFRPPVPIFAVTKDADAARKMQLYFGVYPIVADSTDVVDALRSAKLLKKGSTVIHVEGTKAHSITV